MWWISETYFPGGKYNKSKSIFDRIEELYNDLIKKEKTYILYHNFNPIVPDKKKYYKYECAFDFEAMLKKIEITDNEKKLQITSEHVPVSVSIFSNVPEYDNKPIFICDSNPKKLIRNFVQNILKINIIKSKKNKWE